MNMPVLYGQGERAFVLTEQAETKFPVSVLEKNLHKNPEFQIFSLVPKLHLRWQSLC